LAQILGQPCECYLCARHLRPRVHTRGAAIGKSQDPWYTDAIQYYLVLNKDPAGGGGGADDVRRRAVGHHLREQRNLVGRERLPRGLGAHARLARVVA
jgi:hypothetical protein